MTITEILIIEKKIEDIKKQISKCQDPKELASLSKSLKDFESKIDNLKHSFNI